VSQPQAPPFGLILIIGSALFPDSEEEVALKEIKNKKLESIEDKKRQKRKQRQKPMN
jgi:hypothetical protein